jgi:hypothetical protein
MKLTEYQNYVDELEDKMSIDPENNGHNYYIDLECMDRVCSCGAVYGRGEWWKKQCPNNKKSI